MRVCGETGLFGVSIPEEYGGLGGGSFENCIVVEELSKACLGVSVSYAASLLGSYPILLGGSEEQKKKYLPDDRERQENSLPSGSRKPEPAVMHRASELKREK